MRIFYVLAVLFFLTSCFDSYRSKETGVESVCIWDGAILRKGPVRKSPQLSTLSLGEKIYFLGEAKVDSTYKNMEYAKVRLSDGAIGWVHRAVIIEGAYVAAIIENTPIYRRPDLLTLTQKKYDKMEMVAVRETKGDWVEVFGNRKFKNGWIKSIAITKKDEDVAFAIQARNELYRKGKLQKYKISKFLEEIPYKGSQFVGYLTSFQKSDSVIISEEASHADTIEMDIAEESVKDTLKKVDVKTDSLKVDEKSVPDSLKTAAVEMPDSLLADNGEGNIVKQVVDTLIQVKDSIK